MPMTATKPKQRIAYCIPALYNSGGMERVLSVKANYLARLGYEVHIITTDQMGRGVYFPLHETIQLHHLDLNYEGSNGSLWGKAKALLLDRSRHKRMLTKLLSEIQPDCTISMFGHEAPFLPKLRVGGVKVLEYHFSKLKRLQYGRQGIWGILDRYYTYLDERVVRRYDKFVVLTEEDKALWGELPNITVIPNPQPFTSELCSDLKAKQVVAAGRYCHQKNFEALIRIWAKLQPWFPEWQLAIYGDGELRKDLEALVSELGLTSSINLAPPTNDMQAVYRNSSIYAMTSRYEGLPMVLIEAQTMGLPIVAYACPCGPRDIITDFRDGFLVEPGDEATFAERLQILMLVDERREAMGYSAREASKRYSIERIMQSWQELLDELLPSK